MILLTGGRGTSSRGGWWRPPRDGYCCGRYASYWNAFLLIQDFPHRRGRHVGWGSSYFFTELNSSCGKVMFLQVSVCPQWAMRGGGVAGGHAWLWGYPWQERRPLDSWIFTKHLAKKEVSAPSLRHHPPVTIPSNTHINTRKFRSACPLCNKPYYYCHEKRSSKCFVSNKKWAQSYSKNSPANPRAFSPLSLYCRRFWESEIEFDIFGPDWDTDIVNS